MIHEMECFYYNAMVSFKYKLDVHQNEAAFFHTHFCIKHINRS